MENYCILGNPNVGKTSLFNALTGSYEYVGNWSGVTVEKKVGKLKHHLGELIDLPGIYDLSPISVDETIVTDYLLNNQFTGMINIVDASQLKRNMQLTIQLLELNKPMYIGLNMIDVATKRGIHIDYHKLMKKLKTPIFPVVARTGKGTDHLLGEIKYLGEEAQPHFKLNYGEMIESAIKDICQFIMAETTHSNYEARFIAIQYLLDNIQITKELSQHLLDKLLTIRQRLIQKLNGTTIRREMERIRNQFIDMLLQDIVTYPDDDKQFFSTKLDKILTHKYLGIPIFLGIMWLIFQTTSTRQNYRLLFRSYRR